MLAPYGKCRVSQFGDVVMLNRYYGWYVDTGDLAAAEATWEARSFRSTAAAEDISTMIGSWPARR
jgi:hypothetical protein